MSRFLSASGVFLAGLFIMAILIRGALPGRAATWYVATNGDDTAAGTAWTNAVLTISNGVAKATGADAIVLMSNGVYFLTTNVVIDKAVKVLGAGATRDEVIVNGSGATRGFYLMHASAMIERLTITNGDVRSYATPKGGGVYIDGLSFNGMIRDCAVRNCTANDGGGVYFYYGGSFSNGLVTGCVATNSGGGIYDYISAGIVRGVVVSNNISYLQSSLGGGGIMINQGGKVIACEIVSNRAYQSAGGIYMSYANPAIVDGCLIKDNWLETGVNHGGGGVRLVGGNCFLINSTISGNSALPLGSGGGVNFYQGTGSTVSNCVIVSNWANYAGGVYIQGTAPSFLKNNLIAYNTGTNYAGGIYWYQYASVQNCTIVSNIAGNDGGGLYCNQTGSVVNTIIYANLASGANSNILLSGVGQSFTNCCTMPTNDLVGSGNIQADPLFVDRDAGNFRLQGPSPCVNQGLNQSWMTNAVDLDGRIRIRYNIVDIGCYETLLSGTIYGFR